MTRRRQSNAFTLVELLVVILIIAILLALLVPAIIGAVRTARNAQTSTEIQALQTALNQFKVSFSDYPPSRLYLNESGYFPTGDTTSLANIYGGGTDITMGQLAQRSLRYMQKFWPRTQFMSIQPSNPVWAYDFNGNGQWDSTSPISQSPYHGGFIIQGHQCLVFFLGGIPYNAGGGIGMSGFGKNPVNPFTNMIVGNAMYRGGASAAAPSSTQPFFEFRGSRLAYDPAEASINNGVPYFMPGYIDPLGNATPSPGVSVNFYAYFSSYGASYDPNDVNFHEPDASTGTATTGLNVNVGFQTFNSGGGSNGITCTSFAPNPYTSSITMPASGTAVFQSPNTFQIISSGFDGLYGIGGQYQPNGGNTLQYDPNAAVPQDPAIRSTENDNLTNFTQSKLGG